MEKKKINPMTVIQYPMKTTMVTLLQDIGEIPRLLDAKIIELGLQVTGPHTWVYYSCDGDPVKEFDMTIAVPVAEAKGDPGKFSFAELPEFYCACTEHKGAWSKLGETYEKFIPEILQNGLIMTGYSREIYHLCDFVNQENCITEVQVGIN